MRTADAYRILELSPGASDEEVRTAWRDLTKVWHPDRFAHDAELQRKAQEKMKEINSAYEAIRADRSGRGWRESSRPEDPQGEQERSAPPWRVRSGGREYAAPDLGTILVWAAGGKIGREAEVLDPAGGSWVRLDSIPEGRAALERASVRRTRGWGVTCLAIAIFFLMRRPTLGGFIIAGTLFLVAMFLFSRK
jgi:hypothetical protein